jgi:hypothetical protein
VSHDAKTPLADFFRILLGLRLGRRLLQAIGGVSLSRH